MTSEEIQQLVQDALALDEVRVSLEGGHASVVAVSDRFADLSRVKKQQLVYGPLKPMIATGELHAVSIKTYTPAEWKRQQKLGMLS
ncbi:BolA family protein [Pseudidiomarina sp.]|uniref:BolA family protein n=1 Tax=Pseudidiomarina sp. TaxID=2081707 RepID=UPI00299F4978|nr:BolA family protein [Pseudidiomarina sp.]MDX1705204.1 BolA family protein [Pseudidiomarina sp.]